MFEDTYRLRMVLNSCSVIKAYPARAGFEPSPARRGALAGLHLNDGEHALALSSTL